MKLKRLLKNIIYPIIALLLFIVVWQIVAVVEKKPLVLPEVDVVFNSLFNILGTKIAWIAVSGTITDTLSAFSLSFVLALILAIISAIYPVVHKLLSPINTILRAAPTMAVIMLSVFWLEFNEIPLFIGFLIAFPLMYSLFREAFVSVDKNLLDMAKVFNVSKKDQLINIYIPSVLPNLLNSCQSTISLTCKVVIAAEVMAYVNNTIGFEMHIANTDIQTATLLAYTLLAIILSFIFELIFIVLKHLAEVKYGY